MIECPAGKVKCEHLVWNPSSGKDCPECSAHNANVDIALYNQCPWTYNQKAVESKFDKAWEFFKKSPSGVANLHGFEVNKTDLITALKDAGFTDD